MGSVWGPIEYEYGLRLEWPSRESLTIKYGWFSLVPQTELVQSTQRYSSGLGHDGWLGGWLRLNYCDVIMPVVVSVSCH